MSNKRGFIVGCDEYSELGLNAQLERAVADAQKMSVTLNGLNFKTTLVQNVGRTNFILKLQRFIDTIEKDDIVFFFFAGHGVSLGGGNFIVPSDVRAADLRDETVLRGMTISETEILLNIQEKKPSLTINVLDACRDNPFFQPGFRVLKPTSGLCENSSLPTGIYSIYSAGMNQTALDHLGEGDDHENSVFTRVFSNRLSEGGSNYLQDIMIDVKIDVFALAETVNHEQSPAVYDQTIGGRIWISDWLPISRQPAGRQRGSTPKTTAKNIGLFSIIGEYEVYSDYLISFVQKLQTEYGISFEISHSEMFRAFQKLQHLTDFKNAGSKQSAPRLSHFKLGAYLLKTLSTTGWISSITIPIDKKKPKVGRDPVLENVLVMGSTYLAWLLTINTLLFFEAQRLDISEPLDMEIDEATERKILYGLEYREMSISDIILILKGLFAR